MKCYCGYLKNDEMLRNSASGGIATALAIWGIQLNAVVYGVAYKSDFKGAQYIRITDINDVDKLRGSKYIKASILLENGESGYEMAAKDLLCEKSVYWFGLPCEIAGLKKYLNDRKIDTSNLVTIDLICHGPTYPKVAEEFIDALEEKYKSKIVNFSVRYKKPNWVPPYLYAEFENGKVYCEKFYRTDYGIAFSLLTLPGCYSCQVKGDKHCADITIGDYWGITKEDECYNAKGVSVAVCHNEKAERLVHKLDDFVLFEADEAKFLKGNPRYETPICETDRAVKFRIDIAEKGLKRACWNSLSLKGKIYRIIAECILLFRI